MTRFFVLAAICALPLAPSSALAQDNEYLALREAIGSLRPDLSQVAAVESLVLERPAARFELSNGEIALLELDGRTVGAVFVGEGRFSFWANSAMEQGQLRRNFEVDSVSQRLDKAVFLFADHTEQELRAALDLGPAEEPDDAKGAVEDAMRYLEVEDDDLGFDVGVMRAFLNGDATELFHAHLEVEDDGPLYYRYDASRAEAVTLGRKARRGRVYDLVSSFDVERERDPVWQGRDRAPAEIIHYRIVSTIEDNLDFEAMAHVFLVVSRGGQQWVPFSLFAELEVDSVRWGGQRTPHVRDDEAFQLWVRSPAAVDAGSTHEVEFFYGGDLIRKVEGFVFLRSRTGWYPRVGTTDATFDMHFTSPEKYPFAASGVEVAREVVDDRIATQWSVQRPSPHASFNLGEFTETVIEDPRVPKVTLHVAERAHRRIEGLLLQQDMAEQVGADIVNSLAFFTDTYGAPPVEALAVTEIPYNHGQAFPEMIQLSWSTFQWTGSKGHDEIFRAHEVAHLWWGLSARPATYHDRWLSEGLAEFSGLWYMQRILFNNEIYFDRLNDAKDRILKRREEAAPIALGPRVFSSRTTEDYQIQIYEKGAWVIQMLRNLMLDLDTMNEDVFKGVMRDLYALGQQRPISTEDLRALVEQHTGIDMGWFFDQWVYGSDVPTYRVSYAGEEVEGGYRVRGTVLQEHVPDDFKMVVPVRVDFGEEGWARFRVLVEGPVTEFDFPLMPRKPDAVVFNDLGSVLAEVKDDGGWE